jgi:thioredoxin-related protein
MFGGSFDEAKSAGQSQGKWLLVNIQHTKEFACQALNRDVWSNPTVKHLLRENFVFWQVYEDSAEGERYKQFYPFSILPHVAIIDPRTGERLVQMGKMSSDEFISIVSDFVAEHERLQANQPNHKTKSSPKKQRLSNNIIDASEESQLMAAIAESLTNPKPKKRKVTAKKIITVQSDSDSSTFHSPDENDSSTCDSDAICEIKRVGRSTDEYSDVRTNGKQVKTSGQKSSVSKKNTRKATASVGTNSVNDFVSGRDELVQSGGKGGEVSSGETTDTQLVNNYEQMSLEAGMRQDVVDKQEERQHGVIDSLLALPGNDCGEKCNLLLRLPDGSRKTICLPALQPLAVSCLVIYLHRA